MVSALELVPVQLVRECGDMLLVSVTPWCKEVGLCVQFLPGGNDIPRTDLRDHHFYCLVFVPDVIFL